MKREAVFELVRRFLESDFPELCCTILFIITWFTFCILFGLFSDIKDGVAVVILSLFLSVLFTGIVFIVMMLICYTIRDLKSELEEIEEEQKEH